MSKLVKAVVALGSVAAIGAVVGYVCKKHHDEIDMGVKKFKDAVNEKLNENTAEMEEAVNQMYEDGEFDVAGDAVPEEDNVVVNQEENVEEADPVEDTVDTAEVPEETEVENPVQEDVQ